MPIPDLVSMGSIIQNSLYGNRTTKKNRWKPLKNRHERQRDNGGRCKHLHT
jgi:hypothetical protein